MRRESDYGIVLLTCIARRPGDDTASARELALATHLPAPMVQKILKRLTRAGLLRSQRGVAGGYRLARPAAAISVAEVITALEGPIGITECTSEAPTTCDIAALCAVKSNWETINRAVRDALSHITLEQMTAPFDAVPAAGAAAVRDDTPPHPEDDDD